MGQLSQRKCHFHKEKWHPAHFFGVYLFPNTHPYEAVYLCQLLCYRHNW